MAKYPYLNIGGPVVGAGGILAAMLSWNVNHDVVWAVIHFLLSWIYVIYWMLVHYNHHAIVIG